MLQTGLRSQLPLSESFHQEYLVYFRILPLEVTAEHVRVAVAGSPDADVLEDLQRFYGRDLELIELDAAALEEAIRLTFASAESVVELVRDLDSSVEVADHLPDQSQSDVRGLANQPPVVRFVNLLIREAHDAGASDIHLEAARDGLRVRVRLDGVLSDAPSPPAGLQAAVVSRLKLLAELDISERRLPQDGRIRVRLETGELDLRVSTVPTLHGESVALRLLDRGGRPVSLGELGMSPDILAGMGALAQRSHGIVLATGPTGSGKTTTLYASLALRRAGQEKIITVEDPIEYFLEGVTQVPVHSKTGVSFSTALRSILRQDPDVVMVGEMRDAETTAVATQAALTGHLVFSTLHTNDAISAITRLIDLRVEPYLVAATLEGVLAQRLVRRICPDCRRSAEVDPAVVALLAQQPVGKATLQHGTGCTGCRQTGYRGRLGIFELLVVKDELKAQIARGADASDLRRCAVEAGMRSLRQDGWHKVQAGLTTVEEVLRVLGN